MKKIKTVFSAFKEMHRLEKRLLPTSIVVAIVTAVMPFINIWFTSKIIDLLDIGTSMSDLAVYIGLIVSINFIGSWNKCRFVLHQLLFRRYVLYVPLTDV